MDGSYNLGLVFISYVVSILGALTALELAGGLASARTGAQRIAIILLGGVAMGGGAIWAMHFIAMVAHRMPMVVTYDSGITIFSALVAIAASAAGLAIAGLGRRSMPRLVGGGLVMGLGVAAMHYIGMEAMLMPATLQYDPSIVALSVVIAVVAATAALWIAFHLSGLWLMLLSAPVMGAAVCGMHYTGMAATSYIATDMAGTPWVLGAMSGHNLGISIFVVVGVVLGAAIPFCYLWSHDRQAQESLQR
ncbi:MHYT domain-containing protein [Marinobacter sp. M1N3S26]|uniref:MHYT domain-containing protein n=1 Tax=Marinobacter sp. M1N3S26 TaxID=3382299 RepID=UPI00387A8A0B